MIKLCKVYACENGMLGLHLTRAPWDPYPWISDIQLDSSAAQSGMRTGDTVLEINDCDVLGQRIIDIAERVRQHWESGANFITMVIWRNKTEEESGGCGSAGDGETNCDNDKGKAHINQQSLQKFATCLQHISQLLECPVCLEIIRPPSWQCCNGHVLCNNCRSRSLKCPVCRVPLGPRGRCLLADKLFLLLAESFPNENARSNCKALTEKRRNSPEFQNHYSTALDSLTHVSKTKDIPKSIENGKILENFKSKRHETKTNSKLHSPLLTMTMTSSSGSGSGCNNGNMQDSTSPVGDRVGKGEA